MAIAPTYPGVYIEELPSPVHTIAGVATSITAFVGYTARGIDNRAERILSFSDYERQFGGIDSQSEVSYAVQQFFANGGSQGYVVRVPHTGAVAASVTFSNLVFTALSTGAWANGNLLIDVDYNGVDQSTATGEPSAFNLTITNLEDGTVETFPSVSLNFNKSSYALAVVNDPDTGSQLANVTLAAPWGATPSATPPVQTGIVGAVLPLSTVGTTRVLAGVNTALGGSNTATTVSSTHDFGFALTTTEPPPPLAPLPLDVKVFGRNGTIPQTVAGLAAQIAQTINAVLRINWPGASVSCSAVTPPGGTGQAIRIVATFPGANGQIGHNDAVIAIAARRRRAGCRTPQRCWVSAAARRSPRATSRITRPARQTPSPRRPLL